MMLNKIRNKSQKKEILSFLTPQKSKIDIKHYKYAGLSLFSAIYKNYGIIIDNDNLKERYGDVIKPLVDILKKNKMRDINLLQLNNIIYELDKKDGEIIYTHGNILKNLIYVHDCYNILLDDNGNLVFISKLSEKENDMQLSKKMNLFIQKTFSGLYRALHNTFLN